MTDAAARYQSIDGQARPSWNLVYNPTSGNWELEQQAVLEAVTGNLYLILDDVETLLTSIDATLSAQQQGYEFVDWATGDPTYLGYLDKDGNYIIKKYDLTNNTVTFSSGSSGYATAWTNRATETYQTYDAEF